MPEFIGYPLADIDTLILRKYKAGDGFNSLIDTFLITSTNSHYLVDSNLHIGVNINVGNYGSNGLNKGAIQVGYDWKLFIPAVNRTVAISGIASEHNTGKKGIFGEGASCSNQIFSFWQDGVVHSDGSNIFHVQR